VTQGIRPADVVAAAECVAGALEAALDLDWSVRAGTLDWTVDHTIAHLTAAPVKYSLYLASRSTRFIAVTIEAWPGATKAERIDSIVPVAQGLANIAAAAPDDARGMHSSGMLDAEGFVALGCLELLVHAHDVTQGLGLPFQPSDDLCSRMVARLMPWLAGTGPAWETILWHTGRVDIAERGPSSNGDMWRAIGIPLTEWDGTIPVRDPRPVVEWIRDETERRWLPRYAE